MLITSEIGYVGHRKITFLSELLQFFFNEKNAFPIIYREDESCPCYHFCSFLPRGQKPCWVRFHADNPTTAVMIGLPLSWYPSAITGFPLRNYFLYARNPPIGINTHLDCTSPKPSSICTCTSLSATEIWNFLRGILCNVVSKCTLLFVEFAYILRKFMFPLL